MKLKLFFLTTALSTSVAISTAFAGFFVQGGIGADSTKTKINDIITLDASTNQVEAEVETETKATGMTLGLGLGYTLKTPNHPKFKYSFIANYSMQMGKSDKEEVSEEGDVYKVTTKNLSNLDIYGQVGYELSTDFMLYGNLGLTSMMYSLERDVTIDDQGVETKFSLKDTGRHVGFLIGFGGQMKLNEKTSLFAEVKTRTGKNSADASEVKIKSQSMGLLVGAKYMF
jgi:outer membrane autotransporter protein